MKLIKQLILGNEIRLMEVEKEELGDQILDLGILNEDLKAAITEICDLTQNSNVQILHVGYTKHLDRRMVIVYSPKDSFDVYLLQIYERSLLKFNRHTICILTTYNSDNNALYIEDIQTGDNINRGFGSVAMNVLKDLARRKGIKSISGKIVSKDWSPRLIHFYKKHGFDIHLDNESKSGRIKIKL